MGCTQRRWRWIAEPCAPGPERSYDRVMTDAPSYQGGSAFLRWWPPVLVVLAGRSLLLRSAFSGLGYRFA